MTMMKFYREDNGDCDMESLWAYEGVVLPGGQIILGRWWRPDGVTDHEVRKANLDEDVTLLTLIISAAILWSILTLELR